jgi:tetratricopeptide (TPR) repeat protein
MKITTKLLVCCASLALFTSCLSNSWGHRPQNADPEERLAELMTKYNECRGEDCQGDGTRHILVDAERYKNEIERLALEFPYHVPTLMACAGLAYDHNEIQECQKYCDRIFSASPVHPDAAVLRSKVAIREGNLSFAKRLLEAQRDYTPDHAPLREALSAVLYLTKDYDGAAREIDAAGNLGAPDWRVQFNRGLIAEARGDTKAAVTAYEASVAANPDFGPAQSRLAGRKADGGVQ